MPSVFGRFIHSAVIWPKEGIDVYGRPSWGMPFVITCRWEQRTTVFVDQGGQQARAANRVYVDRVLSMGDFIVKGDDLDLSEYPEPNPDAAEIKEFRAIENVAGDKVEYRVLV